MRLFGTSLILSLTLAGAAFAGPFEDGVASYGKGDYKTAAQAFGKAARAGHMDAQSNLGLLYELGRGVERDHAKAVSWYRKAADKGQVAAQYNLALKYKKGQGVKKNVVESARWLVKAGTQNDVPSLRFLHDLQLKGLPPDLMPSVPAPHKPSFRTSLPYEAVYNADMQLRGVDQIPDTLFVTYRRRLEAFCQGWVEKTTITIKIALPGVPEMDILSETENREGRDGNWPEINLNVTRPGKKKQSASVLVLRDGPTGPGRWIFKAPELSIVKMNPGILFPLAAQDVYIKRARRGKFVNTNSQFDGVNGVIKATIIYSLRSRRRAPFKGMCISWPERPGIRRSRLAV